MAFTAAVSYVAVLSLILCLFMYMDKERAKNREWRIAERTLFMLAFFGGACGGVLGMYLFRHKTKHNSFAFGFPILAALQVYILVGLYS